MIGHRGAMLGRSMRRWGIASFAVAALVLAGAGCSSPPPDRADVVRALRTSGIPAAQARCTANAIYDNLTDQQVRQLVERGNGGTPKDDPTRTDDPLEKLNTAMAACRAQTEPTTTGGVTTTTAGASIGTVGDTSASTTTAPPVGSTDPPSPSSTTTPVTTTR